MAPGIKCLHWLEFVTDTRFINPSALESFPDEEYQSAGFQKKFSDWKRIQKKIQKISNIKNIDNTKNLKLKQKTSLQFTLGHDRHQDLQIRKEINRIVNTV
jgi:hypothetical protein